MTPVTRPPMGCRCPRPCEYVAWTLLDDSERAEGHTQRFGLVEVEPSTLRRMPKRSSRAYRDLVMAEAAPAHPA